MVIKLSKKQANLLFVGFIILNLILFSVVIYYLYSYKEEYLNNPLSYGVKKMNLGQCTMSCYSEGNYQPKYFSINATSFYQDLKGGLINNIQYGK